MAGLLIPAAAGIGPAEQVDAVADELRRWASLPFDWGATDCGLSILRYVERIVGKLLDPQPWHRSALEAARLLKAAGGYPAYCAWIMEQLGCPLTDDPLRGDVALVDLDGVGLTACLCLGPASLRSAESMWAARGDRAIMMLPARHEIAWRVPCPRR
jgi:hypothetical protein